MKKTNIDALKKDVRAVFSKLKHIPTQREYDKQLSALLVLFPPKLLENLVFSRFFGGHHRLTKLVLLGKIKPVKNAFCNRTADN